MPDLEAPGLLDAVARFPVFADVESLGFRGFVDAQTNSPAQHAQQTPRDHAGESCGIDCGKALGDQLGSDIELTKAPQPGRTEHGYQHCPHDATDAMHAKYIKGIIITETVLQLGTTEPA